jgi:hypothetical protein
MPRTPCKKTKKRLFFIAVPFFVAVHFQHMELVRAYKKEVRLAYAARQFPYVGTLLKKRVKTVRVRK